LVKDYILILDDLMKKIFLLSLIGLLASCSSLEKNMVKRGDASIKGGVYKNSTWSTSLNFKRVSWYQELTLLFDSIYAEIPVESEFRTWFSRSERTRVRDCGQLYLTVNYAYEAEKISHGLFNSQMRDYQFKQIAAPNFIRSLRMHPDFQQLSLSLHKIGLFCRKSKLEDPIFINFPNYKELKL
jgi:hypothetical protein